MATPLELHLMNYLHNPFKARAHQSAAAQAVSASTNTQVTLDAVDFDPNGNFTSNHYTAPVSGYYQVIGTVGASASPAGVGQLQAFIEVNGVVRSFGGVNYFAASQTTPPASNVADILQLNSGDIITLWAWSGGTGCSLYNNTSRTFLSISLISPL